MANTGNMELIFPNGITDAMRRLHLLFFLNCVVCIYVCSNEKQQMSSCSFG